MNRGLSILFVAASLIVLAGCTTVPPMESLGEIPVPAAMDPSTPTDVITLGPRQYVTYRIGMPGTFPGDMVWFEVATNDSVFGPSILLDSGGGQTYTSNSEQGFQLVDADLLAPTEPGFHTSAINLTKQCLGPCIAVGSILGTETLQVQNTSTVARNVELYVYSDAMQDLNEPENDSPSTAPSLVRGEEVDSGAIELIGDWDYYFASTHGWFELSVPSGAPMIAEILDNDGTTLIESIGPDQQAEIFAGEYVRIRGIDDAYAGPPSGSGFLYYVSLFGP